MDSGKRITEPTPSVIISDALANFFGITEREMLQSEVLRRIWEYIKVNRLEVNNEEIKYAPTSCIDIDALKFNMMVVLIITDKLIDSFFC